MILGSGRRTYLHTYEDIFSYHNLSDSLRPGLPPPSLYDLHSSAHDSFTHSHSFTQYHPHPFPALCICHNSRKDNR